MYVVHSRSPRRFKTLEEATAFASRYFERTGNIVAITLSPKK
jgi:hypothetical protein